MRSDFAGENARLVRLSGDRSVHLDDHLDNLAASSGRVGERAIGERGERERLVRASMPFASQANATAVAIVVAVAVIRRPMVPV
ncbi:hypothetical protein EAG_13067 [Camponotus floridanus]|uniref:Uncharacterized protein n=1 Tax=Camponotus floridanus TaxID=104421 RepID=E1ZZS3_CAMFO|nr:hypothetical protein EAG_13067 [Camponotus floridanus]